MKRIVSFLLVIMMLTATAGAVDLYVDTQKVNTDTPPTIVGGRTLVPVRAIFEAIGATVEWDSVSRTATGVKGATTVSIQIDNTTAYVNGEARALDVPAQLINNRTMVPARFISEAMGCEVTWYQKTQTAAVANQVKGQHIYVTKTGKKYHFSGTCNGGTYYEATLAEAMGRGLEPCDKCVLTNSSADNTNSSNNATLPNGKYKTTVLRVIDGDTFVVNYNGVEEKVRLIGVDTPKSVYSGSGKNTDAGFAASEFTTVHLTGKEVELEFDVQQQDQYGHLLAYAYVGGEMFNEKLLKTGYSNIATNSKNVKYIDDFKKIVENRDQSIPSGEYYDGYMKAPSAIYRLPKALNNMSDAFLYDDGLIINLDLDIDAEYDCIFLQTNRGTIALLNAFDFSDFYTLKHGDSKRIGFMYVTSLESSNVPVGVFIETLSKSADSDIPDWLLNDTPTVPTPPSWNTTVPAEATEATQGQKNALNAAKNYLKIMAFSYNGIIEQLEFEKYTHTDAVYAADHCGADWSAQAAKKANSYLETMPFSYKGLIEQLEFEGFTHDQAVYGVDQCGADWNAQAAKKAKSYLDMMSFSRDGLIGQLEFEGFTHDQAVYGASQNGY